MKKHKRSRAKKYRNHLLDIFVIVFSITISIWFNNLNEERKARNEAELFLKQLQPDLENDIVILGENIGQMDYLIENTKFLLDINESIPDSIVGPRTTFGFANRYFNVARYEGFKTSGKIGTIPNSSLKNELLIYYQKTLPQLTDGYDFQKYLYLEYLKVDYENKSWYEIYKRNNVISLMRNIRFNLERNKKQSEAAIVDLKKIVAKIEKID